MTMSSNKYHEYYTVVYRVDSSGESHRVVILDDNAKPKPRPAKKINALSESLEQPGLNIWPNWSKKRWF